MDMIGSILRVLFGFILACLAAGVTIVLFVYTPVELAMDAGDRVSEAGMLSLAAATHAAVFAAPLALIGAAIGEWRGLKTWTYYALVGVLIAIVGFLVQYSSESGGTVSILNTYALSAFVVTGIIAGFVYWLVAGRLAGGPDADMSVGDVSPPARPTPPPRPAADEA
jgi:hypothetical protein